MEVKDRLRIIRQFKNISTHQLSALTGYGQSLISRMETGKRKITVDDIIVFANSLEVPIEAFFYDNRMLEYMKR
jgi:transcriptional regulator with XRE-family HTH domain